MGKVTAIFVVGIEVTDRTLAEKALRQSKKMEAVGQPTGGLAPDFNNLLGGVMGALGLSKMKLDQAALEDIPRLLKLGKPR